MFKTKRLVSNVRDYKRHSYTYENKSMYLPQFDAVCLRRHVNSFKKLEDKSSIIHIFGWLVVLGLTAL